MGVRGSVGVTVATGFSLGSGLWVGLTMGQFGDVLVGVKLTVGVNVVRTVWVKTGVGLDGLIDAVALALGVAVMMVAFTGGLRFANKLDRRELYAPFFPSAIHEM